MDNRKRNLTWDLGIIAFGVLAAAVLAKSGVLEELLAGAQEWKFLGSLLAGAFFVSIFSVAPAAVVLIEIAKASSAWEAALFGGIGALLGDLLIFSFAKDRLADDVRWLVQKTKQERFVRVFRLKLFRWLVPFVGALVVASPLPDEIGLAMMGFSKMKTFLFVPISFSLNFLGILAMGLIANAAL